MLEYQNFRALLTTTDRDVAILKAASLVLAQPALAQKARVQNGDIITPLNGVAITDRRTLVAEADTLREGGRASLSYQRDGRSRSGETVAMSRPKEAESVAVPFCGGLLRDIMVMPARVGSSAPAVYLLQPSAGSRVTALRRLAWLTVRTIHLASILISISSSTLSALV